MKNNQFVVLLTVGFATVCGIQAQTDPSSDPTASRINALRQKMSKGSSDSSVILVQEKQPEATPAPKPQPTPAQPRRTQQPVLLTPPVEATDPASILGFPVNPPPARAEEKANTPILVTQPQPQPQPAAASVAPRESGEKVWALDPRSSTLPAQIKGDGLEQTMLNMQRGFLIAGFLSEADADAFASREEGDVLKPKPIWSLPVPISIPVMHRSRQLALTPDMLAKAKTIEGRLASLNKRSQELAAEAASILKEWNQILDSGTPTQVLDVNSPSLTTNQGGEINRGEAKEGFEPGKGVSYKVE